MYDARFSGVLLAVSSLPGPYGIGSLGRGPMASALWERPLAVL